MSGSKLTVPIVAIVCLTGGILIGRGMSGSPAPKPAPGSSPAGAAPAPTTKARIKPSVPTSPGTSPEVVRLRREVKELRAQLAAPGRQTGAGDAADDGTNEAPPDLAQMKADLADLAAEGPDSLQKDLFKDLLKRLERSGDDGITMLSETLAASKSAHARFMAATSLAKLGGAEAGAALARSLAEDEDMLVRRMASHGLATSDAMDEPEALRAAMQGDVDWGVRANSAYGLAKAGDAGALDVLEKAYLSPKTPPEHRLGVLGGLSDVAAPSSAPIFRKILAEETGMASLLMAIKAVEQMNDTESLGALDALQAADQPSTVKEAAERAAATIRN